MNEQFDSRNKGFADVDPRRMFRKLEAVPKGMGEIIIEFDYFGLSSLAIVKKLVDTPAIYYCQVPGFKKDVAILEQYRDGQQLWAEMRTGAITPLSQLMGQTIMDADDGCVVCDRK